MGQQDKFGDEKMKNKNRIIFKQYVALLLCFAISLSVAACGSKKTQTTDQEQEDKICTVTFDLNYEGAVSETRSVKANTRTTNYQASRSGYTLEGWYLTAECGDGDVFNFTSYIEKDITLYAKWSKIVNSVTVTFNQNYNGGSTVSITQEAGTPINETLVPECTRLDKQYSGWYTDAKCKKAWDMTSPVNESITLYAGYKTIGTVPRDRQGNIIYDNVTVNLYLGTNLDTGKAMEALIETFNAEHEGKIKIVPATSMKDANDYGLTYKQISGANASIENNYTVSDVYDLAGLKLNSKEWYTQASRNCYVEGKMYHVPIVAGVPFLIYNKSLMTTYNKGSMPSNYESFSQLLSLVYKAESKKDSDFKSIVTHADWTFKEAASYASFIQNDVDYYVYDDGAYKNNWGSQGDASYQAAHYAFVKLYQMFGKDGSLHGGFVENDYSDKYTISAVWKKQAFIGIINIPNSIKGLIGDESIGVLPLSGLFASSGSKQANQIPVHTIGFQFCKAQNVSLTQLAAAAEFVDYVSRNSLSFAEKGWYPLRKSIVESEGFVQSSNDTVKFLQQLGKPEDFRTLDGHVNEKKIINTIGAEGNLIPLLNISNVTSEDMKTSVDYMKRRINSAMN